MRGLVRRTLRLSCRRRRILGGASGALLLLPVMLVLVVVFAVSASATTPATCGTANVLNTGGSTSNFEIDTNANLVVNGAAPCIDWLSGGSGSGFRAGVATKRDKPTGQNDDSFGQGSKEDDPNPTIVAGSIPNNKSDLTSFGTYQEASSPKTLELFWTRVQQPEGTTNMDFELNQKACISGSNCSSNGVTPKRTPGDKLITYDLSRGGTVPTISIRTWTGSAWGAPTVLSGGSNATALGSVNSTAIASSDTGGLGSLSAFTFGEAAISYQALFGGSSGCTSLGSVYVKSRASDSFTAELKDFIAPLTVTVSNCTSVNTILSASSVAVGCSFHYSATLSNASANAGGTVTYTVYSDASCSQNPRDAGTKTVSNGAVPDSNDLVFNTPGTFYWQASYSGDQNNAASKSACTSEVLIVSPAHPQIAIVKDPKSQTIAQGGTAVFQIMVTNTGNVTLTNVHVTDAQSPGCAKTIGTMAPGASTTYTCSKANVSSDFRNVAVATGTPPSGPDVTAQDSADVHVLAPGAPGIDIVKSPKSQQVASGGTATFTITVTNIGAVTLTNVHVTDQASPSCNRTIGTMAPGATTSYTCTATNVTSAFTNVAVATGTPPSGPDVSDSDTANATLLPPGSPAISIVKNPKSQTVANGGTATFTITVTNTGAVTLTNVTVSDPLSPNCDRNIGTLTPGQSVSYTCTKPNVTSDFTNVATGTGTPPSGPNVTATDTAPVHAAPLKPPKKPVTKKKPKVVSHAKPKATG